MVITMSAPSDDVHDVRDSSSHPSIRTVAGDRLELEPEPRAAAVARDFLRLTCSRWDLDAVLESALLVVSELVTNAVTNARSCVTVGVQLRGDHLLIEVQDEDGRLPVRQHNAWDALGGRGLVLVEAVSRTWGSRPCDGGKVVWAQVPFAD